MTTDMLSAVLLVPLTLALVSAVRRLVPSIDGRLLVLLCASLVGVGLSCAARWLLPGPEALGWGLVLARGATAAAVAFGVANWPRWAAQVLRDVLGDVRVSLPKAPVDGGDHGERP